MSLPKNNNRKRRKLMSVSVAGAPLLGLLLSGCPDREVTLIDNSAGTESAGEPMVFSNPKGSMYDQGLAGETVVPDMGGEPVIFSNPKGSMYDEGIAGEEADFGTVEEADFGTVEEADFGTVEAADFGTVEEADFGAVEEADLGVVDVDFGIEEE